MCEPLHEYPLTSDLQLVAKVLFVGFPGVSYVQKTTYSIWQRVFPLKPDAIVPPAFGPLLSAIPPLTPEQQGDFYHPPLENTGETSTTGAFISVLWL